MWSQRGFVLIVDSLHLLCTSLESQAITKDLEKVYFPFLIQIKNTRCDVSCYFSLMYLDQQPTEENGAMIREAKTLFRKYKSFLKGVCFSWIQRLPLLTPLCPKSWRKMWIIGSLCQVALLSSAKEIHSVPPTIDHVEWSLPLVILQKPCLFCSLSLFFQIWTLTSLYVCFLYVSL